MIAIIDYGMGNIHSVRKVIESFGLGHFIAREGGDLNKAEKIILPGVGAFADAMREFKKRGLDRAIIEQIKQKKPFLGICLGMQLLFNQSYEGEGSQGLGVLAGAVNKFSLSAEFKVPHIGWNQLRKKSQDCLLLKDIADNSYVYFCHSYYVEPEDKNVIAAITDYGINFTSVVYKDNIFGVQFHPEKSQAIGLKVLENFINLC
ncbi:MAG: imidazole glycerol phosphate synthase subunit HisH [Candidatus Omnitrophota bacterium]|nr:imidazole glycerol phosphate synthase subunit HisH [Candidatus Omnitrophota bacterium]